jgi:hypothetical protein
MQISKRVNLEFPFMNFLTLRPFHLNWCKTKFKQHSIVTPLTKLAYIFYHIILLLL